MLTSPVVPGVRVPVQGVSVALAYPQPAASRKRHAVS
jgi:hypothetical protein